MLLPCCFMLLSCCFMPLFFLKQNVYRDTQKRFLPIPIGLGWDKKCPTSFWQVCSIWCCLRFFFLLRFIAFFCCVFLLRFLLRFFLLRFSVAFLPFIVLFVYLFNTCSIFTDGAHFMRLRNLSAWRSWDLIQQKPIQIGKLSKLFFSYNMTLIMFLFWILQCFFLKSYLTTVFFF